MRSKELSNDYRYFPDPDLMPLTISEDFVERIRLHCRNYRRHDALAMSKNWVVRGDANAISNDIERAVYFDAAVAAQASAKQCANWIMGELSAYQKKHDVSSRSVRLHRHCWPNSSRGLKTAPCHQKPLKPYLTRCGSGADANIDELIKTLSLAQMNDDGALTQIIDDLIAANPKQFEELRGGKDKMLGFFVPGHEGHPRQGQSATGQ